MKKLMFLLFGLFVLTAIVTGQPDSTAYPVPGGIIDIFADLKYWFGSTATVAGLTIFVTLMVSTYLWKTITKIAKQILALVIAIALVIGGNLANIGFMAEFNWITTVVYGFVVGFMANGLYDLKNVAK